MKRLIDLSLLFVTAPITVPLVLLVMAISRVKLGSPVLFRQMRPGLDGQLFELVKLRTMCSATDEHGRPLPDNQRLGTFGRWLRATSLDELPTLYNVLRGDMSLVGPRPLLPEYLPRYSAQQFRRHEVRPGVTGWAQVHGRNSLDWQSKFALDVWYVDNHSIALDAKILCMTLVAVMRREGINASEDVTMTLFTGNGDAATPVSGRSKQRSSATVP